MKSAWRSSPRRPLGHEVILSPLGILGMGRMRLALTIVLVGLFIGPCLAQDAKIDKIEIIDYGTYSGQIVGQHIESGQQVYKIRNRQHVVTTTTIPAQLGVSFGFRYRVVGSPQGAPVTLTAVFVFPPQGLNDPSVGHIRRQQFRITKRIGDTGNRTYRLGHSWTLVPGVWTFELWDGHRKLAAMNFTMVPQ